MVRIGRGRLYAARQIVSYTRANRSPFPDDKTSEVYILSLDMIAMPITICSDLYNVTTWAAQDLL